MPSVQGIIKRRVLPIFVVVQHFEDDRDNIYRSIINGLLEKYKKINEKSADIEVEMYFLKYNLERIFTSNALLKIETLLDFETSLKTSDIGGTFANVLELLSGALSREGCLTRERLLFTYHFFLYR